MNGDILIIVVKGLAFLLALYAVIHAFVKSAKKEVRRSLLILVIVLTAIFTVSILEPLLGVKDYEGTLSYRTDEQFAKRYLARVAERFAVGLARIQYDITTDFLFDKSSTEQMAEHLDVLLTDLAEDIARGHLVLAAELPEHHVEQLVSLGEQVRTDVLVPLETVEDQRRSLEELHLRLRRVVPEFSERLNAITEHLKEDDE